jgi:hypothetical protein
MEKAHLPGEEKKTRIHQAVEKKPAAEPARADRVEPAALEGLQHQVGNRAVQRLVAQRSGDGPFELDEQTAARIKAERGGGQPVDEAAQQRMTAATGHDLSDVKVHTSAEADTLNHELGAKAFTTGRDIYFREGEYNPHSAEGQELLSHELTHVVQQGTGAVGGASRMTVNAPGDVHEQEADAVAQSLRVSGSAPALSTGVQRESTPEDDEVQTQKDDEEEVQMQEEDEEAVQAQEMEKDEEPVQAQEMENDEELA